MRKYAIAVHEEAHRRFGCCIWQVHEQWYTSSERERVWNREAPPEFAKLGNGEALSTSGTVSAAAHSSYRPDCHTDVQMGRRRKSRKIQAAAFGLATARVLRA